MNVLNIILLKLDSDIQMNQNNHNTKSQNMRVPNHEPQEDMGLASQQSNYRPRQGTGQKIQDARSNSFVVAILLFLMFSLLANWVLYRKVNKLTQNNSNSDPSEFKLPVEINCQEKQLVEWKSSQAHIQIIGPNQLEKVPYPNVVLVQRKGASSPSEHFSQFVQWLKANPADSLILIHSVPPYMALLTGMTSEKHIKIIVSKDTPDLHLIKTNFVMNSIINKFHQEGKKNVAFDSDSDLFVTTSWEWAAANRKINVIVYSDKEREGTQTGVFRLQSKQQCRFPILNKMSAGRFPRGTYLLKRQK